MKKIIGAIVGGLIVFIWSAISHTVLPIGEAGFKVIPPEKETVIMETFKSTITEDGFYFFPGYDISKKMTPEEQKIWEEKYQSGPTGLLLIHPRGSSLMSSWHLFMEFLTNILAAFIGALLLGYISAAYLTRVLMVALLGLFGWFSISLSYWIWYGFPGSFILAEGFDQVVGWFLAGLAMAKIVKPSYSS